MQDLPIISSRHHYVSSEAIDFALAERLDLDGLIRIKSVELAVAHSNNSNIGSIEQLEKLIDLYHKKLTEKCQK